jgi:hypothetical protein
MNEASLDMVSDPADRWLARGNSDEEEEEEEDEDTELGEDEEEEEDDGYSE